MSKHATFKKLIMKCKLQILMKLESRFNSDLVSFYEGLHPKHLFYSRHDWVSQFITSSDTVLDIASGTGCCAYNLSKRCRKVIAVDFQRPLEHYLTQPNLEFHRGDIMEIIPSIKETYTFAVAFHILEHLDDPTGFLKKISADRIAVIVPHEEHWMVSVKKDLGLNWLGDRTHRRLYTHELLRSHLYDGGYGNIELLEFDGDNGIRALARRGQ